MNGSREDVEKVLWNAPMSLAVMATLFGATCGWALLPLSAWVLAAVVGAAGFAMIYRDWHKRSSLLRQFVFPLFVFAGLASVDMGPRQSGFATVAGVLQFEALAFCVVFLLMILNRRRILESLG